MRRIVLLSAIPLLVTLALLLAGCRTEVVEDNIADSYSLGRALKDNLMYVGYCISVGRDAGEVFCAIAFDRDTGIDSLCRGVESNGRHLPDAMTFTLGRGSHNAFEKAGWWRYTEVCERWRVIEALPATAVDEALDGIDELVDDIAAMLGFNVIYDPRDLPSE